jgi:immunity protein Imm1 of predicted polymorphic toxin system
MIVFFQNFQDTADPDNWRAIYSAHELIDLLDKKRCASPFIAHFSAANDFRIEIGIGGDFGCVQISRMDDKPPYLMAVSHQPPMKRGYIEFLCGGTPTPVGASNILTFDELKSVLLDFLETGERSDKVSWRPVRPGDVKEDAEHPFEQ